MIQVLGSLPIRRKFVYYKKPGNMRQTICFLFPFLKKREPEKTFNYLYNNRKLKVISADECKVQNENIAKIDAMRK